MHSFFSHFVVQRLGLTILIRNHRVRIERAEQPLGLGEVMANTARQDEHSMETGPVALFGIRYMRGACRGSVLWMLLTDQSLLA